MNVEERTIVVRDWAAGVLDGAAIELGPPAGAVDKATVRIHLLDIAPEAPARAARRQRYQASLRYLAAASAPNPADAHRMLGQLLFAALASGEMEAETEPPPLALWSAFGVLPQPGLVFRARAWVEPPQPAVSMVREAVFQLHTARPLTGVVVDVAGLALRDAVVVSPELRLSAVTDSHGHFAFPAAPVGAGPTRLIVHAREREGVFALLSQQVADGHVVIQFQ